VLVKAVLILPSHTRHPGYCSEAIHATTDKYPIRPLALFPPSSAEGVSRVYNLPLSRFHLGCATTIFIHKGEYADQVVFHAYSPILGSSESYLALTFPDKN
jgi:hypothetical protein